MHFTKGGLWIHHYCWLSHLSAFYIITQERLPLTEMFASLSITFKDKIQGFLCHRTAFCSCFSQPPEGPQGKAQTECEIRPLCCGKRSANSLEKWHFTLGFPSTHTKGLRNRASISWDHRYNNLYLGLRRTLQPHLPQQGERKHFSASFENHEN